MERVVPNKLTAISTATALSLVKPVNDLNRVKLPLQITLSGNGRNLRAGVQIWYQNRTSGYHMSECRVRWFRRCSRGVAHLQFDALMVRVNNTRRTRAEPCEKHTQSPLNRFVMR